MDTISIRIKLRSAAIFAAEMRNATREIKNAGDAAATANKKARTGAAGFTLLQKSIKPRLMIVGMTLLATAAGAVATNLVALTAAAAPAVGLLGALPGLATAGAQGFGVMALGLMGVGAAVGGLNDQLDPKKFALLSREGQDFALTLDTLKKPVLGLQRSVQRGLFPGLTAGLKSASPAIHALQGPLAGTGRVFGQFAAHLGALVGSRGFLTDLRSQAQFNNVQLGRLGGGALHLVNVFRNLIVASRPLVAWIVRLAAGWAATLDSSVALSRSNGRLTRDFHTIQVTASRVGRLFLALGKSIWNIGAISKRSVGDSLLVNLLLASQALERWTASARGTKAITDFFTGSRQLLGQIVDLLKPLLADGGTITALHLYATGLATMATALEWVARNVPGANTALGVLLITMLAFKKLNIIMFFQGLSDVFKVLKDSTIAARDSTIGLRLQLALLAAQERITAISSTAMWAAVTGPVGLVILAVAAVAAAVVVLYNKWGWFHRAVDNTFGWIKAHWPLLLAILTGPFGLAVYAVVKSMDKIKAAAGSAVHWIADRFRDLISFVRRVPGAISGAISGLPGKALSAAGSLLPHFADGGVMPWTGPALVGERGPEIAHFPVGTRIEPITPTLRAPRLADVRHNTVAGSVGRAAPIHVHAHTTFKLDRKILAKAVADAVADQKAGG